MNIPVFHSEPLFDKSHGIFAEEDLTVGELAIIHDIIIDLRVKIDGIRGFLADLKTNNESISSGTAQELKERNKIPHLSIKTSIYKETSSKLLKDIQLFLGHDWAQLAALTEGSNCSNDQERYKYFIGSYTAVLSCFENAFSIITGEQQHETVYKAENVLAWFKKIMESRFFNTNSRLSDEKIHDHLKRNGLLDKDGISVYISPTE